MIGIFDSGVGGLTVAKEIKKRNPKTPIIYFGDTARVPWGGKSPETIRRYSKEICDFLISKGVDEIVIACNTASALAGEYLKKEYPKVVFHDVINPVVEKIYQENLPVGSKVLIIGTSGTISSGEYENRIMKKNSDLKIISKACPLFVPIIEEGMKDSVMTKVAIKEYLGEFKNKGISRIVLGCTHYPLLREMIEEYFEKKAQCIGSDEEVAKKIIKENLEENGKKDLFYFSDLSEKYLELAGNIYGEDIEAEKINL